MPRYGEAVFAPSEVTVGTRAAFAIEYTASDVPLSPGGGLRMVLPPRAAMAPVSASTSGSGTAKLLRPDPGPDSAATEFFVVLSGSPLKRGESITVQFGNPSQDMPGCDIHTISQTLEATVWVDPDGSRNYIRLAESAVLHCLPGPPARLIALVPSHAVAGKKFDVHVKAVDEFGNPATSYRGTVYFVSQECDLLPQEYTFTDADAGSRRFRAAAASAKLGFNRVTVRDREAGLTGTANPIDIVDRDPELRMCWAEIHGHSYLSNGSGTPDEYYRHARDVEMLDVCAITDHDTSGPEAWAILEYEAIRFYEPGRFVTLFGYEWRSGRDTASSRMSFGHKNVYQIDRGEPVYSHDHPASDTPRKLYHRLQDTRAIIIPHHTSAPIQSSGTGEDGAEKGRHRAFGNDWRFHDSEKERLVEIYSRWGNSEFPGCPRPMRGAEPGGFVQEALGQGCKLGFTAGGDTHYARPGSDLAGDGQFRQGGLTLFYAEDLTRESVFEAMYSRRCYATTGVRIFLEFRINGFCMGEEIVAADPEESRVVSVRVCGTADIDHVDIVKNNDDLYRQDGGGPAAEFEYVDQTPVSGTDFYYVRVTQVDEEMAWSSPIWVTTKE